MIDMPSLIIGLSKMGSQHESRLTAAEQGSPLKRGLRAIYQPRVKSL